MLKITPRYLKFGTICNFSPLTNISDTGLPAALIVVRFFSLYTYPHKYNVIIDVPFKNCPSAGMASAYNSYQK